jgi:UPF0755 protein
MPGQPDPFELFGLTEPSSDRSNDGPGRGAAGSDPADSSDVFPDGDRRPPSAAGTDEYVTVGGAGGGGGFRRWSLVVGVPLLVLVLLVAGLGLWVRGQIDPGSPGEEVAFSVPAGATTSQIAGLLADARIVSNATVFEWYVRWKGGDPFQAGSYEGLRTNMAMGAVIDVLAEGPPPPKPVFFLVREGLWIGEFVKLTLEKFPTMDPAALQKALTTTHPPLQPAGSNNLEGFLFPATYELSQSQVGDAQLLIDKMMDAFDRVAATTGLADATAKLAGVAGRRTITPYEALIVASLIEAEAKVDADRPKIARVIYNRLARGEILGIDATVLYALQQRKETITSSDLRTDSPYNTRLKNGLPPTPINSPGAESIEAALNPAPGDWMYYVLYQTDGTHYFARTAAEFERAKADAKARGVF